jgi:hypothetical protein
MKENLVTRYNLDMSVGEKPVMNVDDLYIVLHHHWTKDTTPIVCIAEKVLNISPFVLFDIYQRSWSTGGISRHQNDWDLGNEDLKTLCYGQISLILLPNPGGNRDHLVMEIDLKHTNHPHHRLHC